MSTETFEITFTDIPTIRMTVTIDTTHSDPLKILDKLFPHLSAYSVVNSSNYTIHNQADNNSEVSHLGLARSISYTA